MSDSMENQVALVTGASRGIGKAIADKLGAAGATVIGTATSDAGAQGISSRFDAAGVKGKGMVFNANDEGASEALMSAITEQFSAVTVLVNNAGITRDNLLMRMKEDDWDAIIDTNLSSVFRLCKLAVKPMVKARGGRIINIASVVGQTGNAGQSNYAAAKAGMIGFGKSLAKELGGRGITHPTISPRRVCSWLLTKQATLPATHLALTAVCSCSNVVFVVPTVKCPIHSIRNRS